jgi:DNA mismatch repair ATPase MutS
VLVEAGITYYFRNSVKRVLAGSEQAFRDLNLLWDTLARIETQQFKSPYLQLLQSGLRSGAVTASRAMARPSGLVNWSYSLGRSPVEAEGNLFLRVLDVPLMLSIQLAFVADEWRKLHGSRVRSWLRVAGEIEALLSLAAYSYEHPADPFPDFTIGAASLDCMGMGHPLIPAATCVRNNVSLPAGVEVLLISGSNMSGKSTLLRAIGVNVVLAMAGAPVRADSLRLSPLRVGASIRLNDSLQDGSSRFYAEITRLRKLFDLTGGDLPLLFLLDELLQGTNSRDRLIGAEGIISAFLNRGAMGFVSTHDLALTEMNGRIIGRLRNLHFQEEFEDGKMHFDYKLREGVVTKSNGLELMRSIGLNV